MAAIKARHSFILTSNQFFFCVSILFLCFLLFVSARISRLSKRERSEENACVRRFCFHLDAFEVRKEMQSCGNWILFLVRRTKEKQKSNVFRTATTETMKNRWKLLTAPIWFDMHTGLISARGQKSMSSFVNLINFLTTKRRSNSFWVQILIKLFLLFVSSSI